MTNENPLKPDTSILAQDVDTITESPEEKKSPIISGEELAAIKEQLKNQIFNELKDDHSRKMDEAKSRREEENTEYAKYVEKMKSSPDPWVDIIGWVRTDEGVKIELEWNDPFVDYLKVNGITGADADQVVQKWVTLLLRDMADQMEERYEGDSKFE